MKNFVVRIANVCLILMIILVYNGITSERVEADEANRLAVEAENAEIEAANAALNGESGTTYADGTYTASAQGFGGLIEVELTVEDGVITDLVIVSADNEDAAYLTMAEDIIQDILDAQSADVDTISGATFSSTGIRDAAEACIAEAAAAGEALAAESSGSLTDGTYTASAQGFGGEIEVELTVEGGVITDLVIVSAENEDAAYLTMAEDIIQDILDAQSADVDTISGATFSSTGIRDAAAACIAAAS